MDPLAQKRLDDEIARLFDHEKDPWEATSIPAPQEFIEPMRALQERAAQRIEEEYRDWLDRFGPSA